MSTMMRKWMGVTMLRVTTKGTRGPCAAKKKGNDLKNDRGRERGKARRRRMRKKKMEENKD